MIIDDSTKLPGSWEVVQLDRVVDVNPKLDKSLYDDELGVSFVPMPAVGAENGAIDVSETKSFVSVKKGYTAFQESDVLFAKITPCMENGKMAVVPELKNELGFGSTEFHVLRTYSGISHQYIYYFVSQKLFRIEAGHNMSGAVGQRRVPAPWLSQISIPLPPKFEQQRIISKIEGLLSALDNGIESLKTAREQLKVYRQSLLKHAFEGRLTEQWRRDNADKLETADDLFVRIQQEREVRYQQQLEDWGKAVNEWKSDGKEGKKPAKPKKLRAVNISELTNKNFDSASGWFFVPLELLITEINQGWSPKCELNREPRDGEWAVIKTTALQPMLYRSDECKPLPSNFEARPKLEIKAGDLLMTRKGPRPRTGVVCLVKETRTHSMLCDTVYRFRSIEEVVIPRYLELVLNSPAIVSELDKRKSGISDSGISLNHGKIKTIGMPLASSIEEQTEVLSVLGEKLEVIDSLVKETDKQIIRSEALRQSILKKAFSGQLVPQDPSDEPASELLKQISEEKAEIEAAAKAAVKKAKPKNPRAANIKSKFKEQA